MAPCLSGKFATNRVRELFLPGIVSADERSVKGFIAHGTTWRQRLVR